MGCVGCVACGVWRVAGVTYATLERSRMTSQFPDDPLGAALFGELLEDLDPDDDRGVEVDDPQEEVTDDDPAALH